MSWQASVEVRDGPYGRRTAPSLDQIWTGETVRFTLRLAEGTPRAAARREGWARLPHLTVVAPNGQRGHATASPGEPLVLEYRFRWPGPRTLRFTGTPANAMAGTDSPPTMRSTIRPTRARLFPVLDLTLEVRVMETPSRTPTMQGRPDLREREWARIRSREAGLEAEGRAAEEAAVAEAGRALGLHRPGGRPGVLAFPMKTDAEIAALATIEEVEEYLADFHYALEATARSNPLRFTRRRIVRRVPQHHYEIGAHWASAWEGGRIEVYEELTFRRTSARVPANWVPPDWEEIRREHRRRSRILYEPDEWLVATVPGASGTVLLTARDLRQSDALEQLWATLDVLDFLSTLFTAGLSVPAVTARRAAVRGLRIAAQRIERAGGREGLRTLRRRVAARRARRPRAPSRSGRATGTPSPAPAPPRSSGPPRADRPDARATGGRPDAAARGTGDPPDALARGTSPGSRSTGSAIVLWSRDVSGPVRLVEMAATGLTHTQVATLGRLINQPLDRTALGSLWRQAMTESRQQIAALQAAIEAGTLRGARTTDRARAIFGSIRGRFWRSVHADPRLRATFEQAGIQLDPDGASPWILMNTLDGRRRITIDIGHGTELSREPLRAFTQHNLTLQFEVENRELLNRMLSSDPFVLDARTRLGRGYSRAGRSRGMGELPEGAARPRRRGAPGGLLSPPGVDARDMAPRASDYDAAIDSIDEALRPIAD